jgi:hypothetical protein
MSPLWSNSHPFKSPKWLKKNARYNDSERVYASRVGIMYDNPNTHIQEVLVPIRNLIYKIGAPTIEQVDWATKTVVGGSGKTLEVKVYWDQAVAVTASPTLAISTSRGAVATHGAITAGSGYTNGTYTNVPLTGGDGSGAQATIIVSGGAVTTVTITAAGTLYSVGNVLSASAATLTPKGPIATVTPTGTSTGSATQTNIAQGSTSGTGSGATFNVTESAGSYLVTVNTPGTGYAPADTVTIVGANLGGTTPANNLTITVNTITLGSGFSTPVATITAATYTLTYNSTDSVLTSGQAAFKNTNVNVVTGEVLTAGGGGGATISGTITDKGDSDNTVGSVATTSTLVGGLGYTAHTGVVTTTNGQGSGLTVNTTVANGQVSTFTIAGTSTGSSTQTAVAIDSTSGSGTGATFNVTEVLSGHVYTVVLNAKGSGYAVADTITLLGSHVGGVDVTNDLVLTVTAVKDGVITAVAVNAAGDGYAVNDVVTVGGTHTTDSTFVVASVSTLAAEKDTSVAPAVTLTIG